jgi:hypothetical protein
MRRRTGDAFGAERDLWRPPSGRLGHRPWHRGLGGPGRSTTGGAKEVTGRARSATLDMAMNSP